MNMYLVFIEGSKRMNVRIPKGKEAEIGKGKGWKAEIRMGDSVKKLDIYDATMSRKHAKIFWEGDKPYILDLGSKNGTKIDGIMIPGWERKKESSKVSLTVGSKILFGSMTLASVEVERDTVTLMEGDSFRLSPEELKKLSKEVGVELEKEEGESVVKDIKKDVEIKVGKQKTKASTNNKYRDLNSANMLFWHLKDYMYKKLYGEAMKQWIKIGQYKDIVCEIDVKRYDLLSNHIEHGREDDGSFVEREVKDIIRLVEEIQATLEEVIPLEPKS